MAGAQLLHRAKRFSVEGILTCLALGGLPGLAEVAKKIDEVCGPAPEVNNFKYRACALAQFARLGPMYAQCVMAS